MPGPDDVPSQDAARLIGAGLPPGRLDALQPRLQALLADFAHLEELDVADLEPLPSYVVTGATDDRCE